MTKKKVILLVVAALFAVSGLTALPSGNITGGVGCIVIAAVCAYFGLKKKSAGKENGNRTPAPAAASGSRVLDTIRTKVVGVTFNNEDGENRQDILSKMSGSEDITVEKYTYNGEPAAYHFTVFLSSSTIAFSIPHFPAGANYFDSTILIFSGAKEVWPVTISWITTASLAFLSWPLTITLHSPF